MNPEEPPISAMPLAKVLRREVHPKASIPPGEAGPVIDFRSSDETLDRYSEFITVAGWKLENYRRNPVVQNAHSYSSLSDTIGKSLITEIRNREPGTLNPEPGPYLYQRILFGVEENPMAKVAYGLYKGGFLNAVSVGFIPLAWENFPDKSSSSSSSSSSSVRRKYLEQELVEVSAVSIPANPSALTLAIKSGAVETGDIKELLRLLNHFCTEKADRVPDTSALGSAIDEARLLHLTKQMNEIRALLRRG
jgi:hypothetical protein